jgi:hypothetical protein
MPVTTATLIRRLAVLAAVGLSACVTPSGDGSEAGETETETGETETETGETEPLDPFACEDPQPILQAGTDTPSGFVRCADGFIHRVEAAVCVNPATVGDCWDPEEGVGCLTDADCDAKPFGVCNHDVSAGYGCDCAYGCESDADCHGAQICACAGVVGEASKCIPADCAAPDQCGDGLCGLEVWIDVCYQARGRTNCTTEATICRTSEDCEPGICFDNEEPLRCIAESGWTCQTQDDLFCGEYCGE